MMCNIHYVGVTAELAEHRKSDRYAKRMTLISI